MASSQQALHSAATLHGKNDEGKRDEENKCKLNTSDCKIPTAQLTRSMCGFLYFLSRVKLSEVQLVLPRVPVRFQLDMCGVVSANVT